METSTLRWILIIAGAALLAGLLLFGNPERKARKPRQRKRADRNAQARQSRQPAQAGR